MLSEGFASCFRTMLSATPPLRVLARLEAEKVGHAQPSGIRLRNRTVTSLAYVRNGVRFAVFQQDRHQVLGDMARGGVTSDMERNAPGSFQEGVEGCVRTGARIGVPAGGRTSMAK
jgi:hypothetical protein